MQNFSAVFGRFSVAAGLAVLLLLTTCRPFSPPEKEAVPLAEHGMVVTAHALASQAGLAVLKAGGNAFDATVAVQFALAVVYPRAGNIGGGGFAVFRQADGTVGSLDFREKAPAAAGRDFYLDSLGNVIEGMSTSGHRAAGVPGSVDGMVRLHERYGQLPWAQVVQPAIELARDGVVLTESEADNLNRFREALTALNPEGTAFVKDTTWVPGDTLFQPELAATLERIRDEGRAGFYEGETARLLAEEMERGHGVITAEDLRNYEAKWREPLTGTFHDFRVIAMAPPSSGGVALLQLLQGSEQYPLQRWGHNTAKTVHIMTELERRVYADRATYLGDPDFFQVPVARITSEDYLNGRWASIQPDRKTPSEEIKEGEVNQIESLETTHFSIVDSARNAVSVTTTLNGYFGCKVVVGGAGFCLNNEMDDFSVKPGVPNMFGLVGGEANAIQPGKRMLSSMTPTIVERKGKLYLVVGTPGGSTIITTVYQVVLNVLEHDMTLPDAVAAKRLHHQWLPDKVLYETGALSDEAKTQLEALGHDLEEVSKLGKIEAILVQPDGTLVGGPDHTRGGDDFASGY
ncbi:gamma-glutamyltranspeptidase / glutathione hydrolase [Catalinimonas alkaloidigena]|uniref:Glutathione hydrolase proenzyme n=1 Tax=Catalinimonas alkaloidigena TaxID=1075417 RepID=A0A1G9RGJ7_9BACT|nr:gamma-glutamyltransferase [Catalinimonas alkaloidigena]SDM22354.1 gamma-glutamyltranspeptidase / glutathione hydrolase [Catalinimonas alkaloidigena]